MVSEQLFFAEVNLMNTSGQLLIGRLALSQSRSVGQSVCQSVCQSVSQSVSQSVCQSVSQSVNQSVNQSVSQSGSQSVYQSVSQQVSQSVSQSITYCLLTTITPPLACDFLSCFTSLGLHNTLVPVALTIRTADQVYFPRAVSLGLAYTLCFVVLHFTCCLAVAVGCITRSCSEN